MPREERAPRKPSVRAILKAAKASGFSRATIDQTTGKIELFSEAAGGSQDADLVDEWIKKHEAK
jgi:hypothetical protein